MKPIPQEWIMIYINQLISVAIGLPEHDAMKETLLQRAHHIMDMIEAFRESDNRGGS